MSTRRKKKTPEPIPQPTYKGSTISIDPSLMGQYRGRGRSPLDAEMESEDAMLAQELKSMRVDEIVLKRRARMAKLQKELSKLEKEGEYDSPSSEMPKMSVAMAQQIANLPDDERRKVIETYAMFSSLSGSKGKGDAMLPLLIGYSKSNSGSSQNDMATYAKAMSDQFKTGIDAMKAVMPPKEKSSNATELLKLFRDLVQDSVKRPMEELAKNMTAQPSAFEQILMNPEMFSRAKEIGMFGSRENRAGSTNVDLEIEKMRGERELQIKHLDLEWRKALLEIESKNQQTDTLMQALTPLSTILSGPLMQRMQQMGQQQGMMHSSVGDVQPSSPVTGTTVLLKCPCGNEQSLTFPGVPPNVIQCPSCKQELQVGAPTGENSH